MKKYISLLCLTIARFAYPIQEAQQLQIAPYTITMANSPLSNPDIFRIVQYYTDNNRTEKRALIIDEDGYSYINVNSVFNNYSIPTPQRTALHSIGSQLHQYESAICIINSHSYDLTTEKLNISTEAAINLLASGGLKTHFLFSEELQNSHLEEKIKSIYESFENEKEAQIVRTELSNALKKDPLLSRILNQLLTVFSKITSLPVLFLIRRMVDHPEFPWLEWQPLLLNGIPLLMLIRSLK